MFLEKRSGILLHQPKAIWGGSTKASVFSGNGVYFSFNFRINNTEDCTDWQIMGQ